MLELVARLRTLAFLLFESACQPTTLKRFAQTEKRAESVEIGKKTIFGMA